MPLSPDDRKAELVRRRVTQTSIAHGLGLTLGHVASVIRGERRSPRIEQAVAERLEMPVDDVFPPTEAAATAAA